MPEPKIGGYIWEEQTNKAQRATELIRGNVRKLVAILGDDTNGRIARVMTDMLLEITDLQAALAELERIGNTEKQKRAGGATPDGEPSP